MSTAQKLIDVAKAFDNAMLVTHTEEGPRARPMHVGQMDDDGTMYFVTGRKTGKVDEIRNDHEVLVTMQGKTQQVSLRGLCEVIDDKARLKEMWKPAWDVWFKDGAEDPDAVLLQVVPTEGEYWDTSGTRMLKFAYEAVKAYFTGDEIDPDAAGDYGRAEL